MKELKDLYCTKCGEMVVAEKGEITGLYAHMTFEVVDDDYWCMGPFEMCEPPAPLTDIEWENLFQEENTI